MSNHKARTWDHKRNKSLDLKFLPLDHHLDAYHLGFVDFIKGCKKNKLLVHIIIYIIIYDANEIVVHC
jgi:hypothetical protein